MLFLWFSFCLPICLDWCSVTINAAASQSQHPDCWEGQKITRRLFMVDNSCKMLTTDAGARHSVYKILCGNQNQRTRRGYNLKVAHENLVLRLYKKNFLIHFRDYFRQLHPNEKCHFPPSNHTLVVMPIKLEPSSEK